MSKKFLRSILVAAALAALVVSCGGKKSSQSVDATSGASSDGQLSATSSAASSGGQGGDLGAVLDNFAKIRTFRAQMTVEQTGQPNQQGTLEVVQPDKLHLTISGIVAGTPTPGIEIISIGQDSYVKVGPNWQKQPGGGAGTIFDPSSIAGFDPASAARGGTDSVNGRKCQLYTFKNTDGDPTEMCVANNLPLRIMTTSANGKITVIFSDYNTPFEIKPPI